MTAAPPAPEDGATHSHREQLEWEKRTGKLVGAAAFVSLLLLVASMILYQRADIPGGSNNSAAALRAIDHHGSTVIATGVLQSLGIFLLVPILWFLYRVTKYRRPQLPRIALVLAVTAPIVVGGVTVASQAEVVNAAGTFVKQKAPNASQAADQLSKLRTAKQQEDAANKLDPNERAKDTLDTGTLRALSGLGLAANLALAFGFIMISLNAMRAGVVSRFIGIVGIIIGVLYVVPLGGPQILQFFWLGAMGLLFLGRWPGAGRGPAWETGEAIPWPSAADRHAETRGEAPPAARPPTLFGGRGRAPAPEPEQPAELPEVVAEAEEGETAGQRRKRRKKKKRR
ncbi:MAG TPA: DUF4386 family protein [Thermoleophilaceae bacterium]